MSPPQLVCKVRGQRLESTQDFSGFEVQLLVQEIRLYFSSFPAPAQPHVFIIIKKTHVNILCFLHTDKVSVVLFRLPVVVQVIATCNDESDMKVISITLVRNRH